MKFYHPSSLSCVMRMCICPTTVRSFALRKDEQTGVLQVLLLCGAYHRGTKEGFTQKRRHTVGCRFCLGDRIASNPCRASYFAPRRLEEHFILFFQSSLGTSAYSSNHPGAKQLQRSMNLKQSCTLSSSDDFCLLFCIYPSSIYVYWPVWIVEAD